MQAHPNDFAAFVEDDEPFEDYCRRLREVCGWRSQCSIDVSITSGTVTFVKAFPR